MLGWYLTFEAVYVLFRVVYYRTNKYLDLYVPDFKGVRVS